MRELHTELPALEPNYLHFNVSVVHVTDGDSAVLHFWESFRFQVDLDVRLVGINAPEKTGITAPAGMAAREYLAELLNGAESLIVQTYKPRPTDKYGRWLAEAWTLRAGVWSNVNQAMIDAGHAVPYWPK